MVPHTVLAFAHEVAWRVGARLREHMVAAYLFGSAALDDWCAESSDIDVTAVADGPLDRELLRSLANDVLELAASAPARGLEFVLYSTEQAAHPDGSVTLNVNAGPRMPTQIDVDIADFWFAIDAAILGERAITLVGPPVRDLFGAVPDTIVRAAVERSLRWHEAHAVDRPHAAVLNACRSWRFLDEGVWSSKSAAAAWAADRAPTTTPLVRRALAARERASAEVSASEAAALVARVRSRYF